MSDCNRETAKYIVIGPNCEVSYHLWDSNAEYHAKELSRLNLDKSAIVAVPIGKVSSTVRTTVAVPEFSKISGASD